jgi:tRNA(adenine34) deaminase
MDSDRCLNSFFTQDQTNFLMANALLLAGKAKDTGEVPAGALIVDDQFRIIAQAHNQVISLCDPTAHAEILAIREAAKAVGNYRLAGLTLISTLEPCPMCLMAAIHARLARVYYGAPEPRWGAAGSLLDLQNLSGLNHHMEIIGGIMAEPCARMIREFFQDRRTAH